MAVETEDVVSSTNTELIELVNQFPEEVRMEAAEFVNSENFISVQDMPTTEFIIATIEGEDLSESEDSPIVKSISHKSEYSCILSLIKFIYSVVISRKLV